MFGLRRSTARRLAARPAGAADMVAVVVSTMCLRLLSTSLWWCGGMGVRTVGLDFAAGVSID